jgi:pimeloyl-ACP methyl ester carboxylesterase
MQLETLVYPATTASAHPPIVLIHGAWHAAWCWEAHFLPYFAAQGYSGTALSFRAHGNSEGRNRLRGKRIQQFADDVAQVAAQFDQPPILISHSMGTLVAQKYLEQHPARAVVLLAPMPPNGVIGATLRIARRHPGRFALVNATLSLHPLIATPALARDAFFSADMPEDTVRAYQQQLQDEAYFAFLDMLLFNLPNAKRVRQRNPTIPMLVLGAEHDHIFTPAEVRQTAKKYGVNAEIYPNMAHDMMLEANWQQVADRIIAWLNEVE